MRAATDPSPPVIDVAPGVVPPRSTTEAARAALEVIRGSEAMLGGALVPARILRIAYKPDGAPCDARLSDGRPDPHGRGLRGAEWIVEAEGTFVGGGAVFPGGASQPEGGIPSLARRACIALEETRTGLQATHLVTIPCWSSEPLDPSFMDGACGPPP